MIKIEQLHPQFIVDEKGEKKSVILSISDFQELIDDLEDLTLINERKEESTTSHKDFIKELTDNGIL